MQSNPNDSESISKVETKFSVIFRDKSISTRANTKVPDVKKSITNLSDHFRYIEETTSMDCDEENYTNPKTLNLLGCSLETNAHKAKYTQEFMKLNTHLDAVKKLNPVFDKLPLIKNVNSINPYDLTLDEERDFSVEKKSIPWEYVLKVNNQNPFDPMKQEIRKQLNIFDLIHDHIQDKGTLSDRWAMNPHHNKSVTFSIYKCRDLVNQANFTGEENLRKAQNKVNLKMFYFVFLSK